MKRGFDKDSLHKIKDQINILEKIELQKYLDIAVNIFSLDIGESGDHDSQEETLEILGK